MPAQQQQQHASKDQKASNPELLAKLNRMLEKFGAVAVNDIKDFYNYYPDEVKGFLGEGAYGKAYIGKARRVPASQSTVQQKQAHLAQQEVLRKEQQQREAEQQQQTLLLNLADPSGNGGVPQTATTRLVVPPPAILIPGASEMGPPSTTSTQAEGGGFMSGPPSMTNAALGSSTTTQPEQAGGPALGSFASGSGPDPTAGLSAKSSGVNFHRPGYPLDASEHSSNSSKPLSDPPTPAGPPVGSSTNNNSATTTTTTTTTTLLESLNNSSSTSQQAASPSASEPLRVIKKIPKERISRKERQIQHMAAELALSMKMKCPRLNSCVGLYHNANYVFMVLEMVTGSTPSDFATRVYYLFAHYDYTRLPEVEKIVAAVEEEWEKTELPRVLAKAANTPKFKDKPLAPDYLSNSKDKFYGRKIEGVLKQLGLGREPSFQCDLYKLVKEQVPVPELKAAVIIKQCLQGVEYMHRHQVVHRDIKTENVIVGETKTSEVIRDPNTGAVIGVRIFETLDVQIIDFGLAKYLRLAGAAMTPSPTMYMVAAKTDTPLASANHSNAGSGTFHPPGGRTSPPPTHNNNNININISAGAPGFYGSSTTGGLNPQAGAPAAANGGGFGGGGGIGATTNLPTPNRDVHDPFASASGMPSAYEQPKDFNVAVTPCGTELYFSLEMVTGILQAGPSKWVTSSRRLPKIDVYACGAMLFRIANDRAPFVLGKSYRPASLEAKMQQLQQLMARGPMFNPNVSQQLKEVCLKLMRNDPQSRPSASEALMDPFFRKVGNVFAYEIYTDGKMHCFCPQQTPSSNPSRATSNGSQVYMSNSLTSTSASASKQHSPNFHGGVLTSQGSFKKTSTESHASGPIGSPHGGYGMRNGGGSSMGACSRSNSLQLPILTPSQMAAAGGGVPPPPGVISGLVPLPVPPGDPLAPPLPNTGVSQPPPIIVEGMEEEVEELDEARLLEFLRAGEDEGDAEGKERGDGSLHVYTPKSAKGDLESPRENFSPHLLVDQPPPGDPGAATLTSSSRWQESEYSTLNLQQRGTTTTGGGGGKQQYLEGAAEDTTTDSSAPLHATTPPVNSSTQSANQTSSPPPQDGEIS